MRTKLLTMKKLFFVVFLFSQFVFSQTDQGTFIFSGNTSADFSKSKTTSGNFVTKTTNFDINPTVGYFVKNNLFVGLAGTFQFSHDNNNQNFITKSTLTVLMPSVGYYFPVEGKLKPYTSGSFGYAHLVEKYKANFDPLFPDPAFENNQTSKFSGFAYAIGAGAGYFITENFSLDAQLSYNFVKVDNKNGVDQREVSGLGLRLGFSIFM